MDILGMRKRIFDLLDPNSHEHAAFRVRLMNVFVIIIGICAVSAGTITALTPSSRIIAGIVTQVVSFIFILEYGIRFWIAPEIKHSDNLTDIQLRRRWALSFEGIIDLLAVVPALSVVSGELQPGAESSAVFVLLWVIKLSTHAPGVEVIAHVFHNERSTLAAAAALFTIALFSAATVVYWVERAGQPEAFGSIPAALWWAVVTLTTTGYGDAVPKTFLGQLLSGFVMICGICVLALLAGILATGFSAELRRREFVRVWDLVAKVPLFSEAGAITISEIVSSLRSRSYPANATIIRRGAPGDSMYFIVSGSVEVQKGTRKIALYDGNFFGEMSLLNRTPRSADVVTTTPCTMLVLNAADFYVLAGKQPNLIAAIANEAKHRHLDESV